MATGFTWYPMLFKLMPNAAHVILIRDPLDRAPSSFYYLEVSRKGVKDVHSKTNKYL